jgi:hypothetical protein
MTELDAASTSDSDIRRRIGTTVVAFLLASLGGGLLMQWLDLGWIGAAGFMLWMLVITAALMRSVNAFSKRTGCASPAMLRYNQRMMWATIAYMIGLFGAVSITDRGWVLPPLLWLVALVPAAGVLAMVWAMGRLLVEEQDEYLRFRMVKQALFACGGLLALSTVWGFLEMFELVVHIQAWASVPVFAILLGVGQCFRGVRT